MIFSNKLDLLWTGTLCLYMLTLLKHARSTRLKFSKFAKMAATISRLRRSSEVSCSDPEETFYKMDTMLTMANQTGGLKHLTLLMSTSVMLSLVRESMRAK